MLGKIVVVYYSSTGHTYQLAQKVVEGAEAAGAQVRLRKVKELAPTEVVNSQPEWKKHLEQTKDVPEASLADLEWANGYIFGTPTRFGGVSAQLKQFIDTTGGLWFEGKLVNKLAAGFTSAQNTHGGQEQTLLNLYTTFYHWGCIIVPPGYTDPLIFAAGGNPYGASATAGEPGQVIGEPVLRSARYLGQRVATVAQWVAAGRNL